MGNWSSGAILGGHHGAVLRSAGRRRRCLESGSSEAHREASPGRWMVPVLDRAGQPGGVQVEIEQTGTSFCSAATSFSGAVLRGEAERAAVPPAVRRAAELRHAAVLLADVRAGNASPATSVPSRSPGGAASSGILTKGHPLAWNFAEPRWLPDDWTDPPAANGAHRRLRGPVSAGLIDRWDVVNEATHFDREEFLRGRPS